ncbi:MAG: LytR family transcriptional regulator [Gemmatimonadales bacterium]|nr:MAG: LytR family transcriptional regulator [Gemmatimonadales bacterium]
MGWGGLLILVLAGTGIWIGATLVDEDGGDLFRSLDRSGGEAPLEERPIPSYGARIRVEVLNAGGVRGMAAEVRDELRDEGFDVVHYGNASTFGREASVVLHRSGELGAAQAVAAALGIREVRSEPDSTLLVEVTVLLGSTWGQEATAGEEPTEEETDGEGGDGPGAGTPGSSNQQPEGKG